MSTHEFWHFEELENVRQPVESNWCWAACYQMVVSLLHSNSYDGLKMCDIVIKHLSHINKPIKEENYCSTNDFDNIVGLRNGIKPPLPDWIDIPLEDDKFIDFSKAIGLKIQEYIVENFSSEQLYEFIVKSLRDSGSPIFCKQSLGDKSSSHLRLISGYANYNGCKYLLITDPNRELEHYFPLSMIKEDSRRMWIFKEIEDSRKITLTRNALVESQLLNYEEKLKNVIPNISPKLEINPLLFFHSSIDFLSYSLQRDFNSTIYNSLIFFREQMKEFACNSTLPWTDGIGLMARPIPSYKAEDLNKLMKELKETSVDKAYFLVEGFEIELQRNFTKNPSVSEFDIVFNLKHLDKIEAQDGFAELSKFQQRLNRVTNINKL